MRARAVALFVALGGIVAFVGLRPVEPTVGSDCEAVASAALVREPVNAISALVILLAGWLIARRHVLPGAAVIAAGGSSAAAHASAHPVARALDGITALLALAAVVTVLARSRPDRRRLAVAGAAAGAGLGLWLLTRTGAAWCDVLGPWGHATWHVLIATAAALAMSAVRE